MENEIYLNYLFKDGGFKKSVQKHDKYVQLLSGNGVEDNKKIYYKPHKRAVIKNIHPIDFIIKYASSYFGLPRDTSPRRRKYGDHFSNIFAAIQGDRPQVVMHDKIETFLTDYHHFKDQLKDKSKLYTEHKIPKKKLKNGKTQYRTLHAPNEELKALQKQAQIILEDVLCLHPHNAVHSYTKRRDNVTNARTHKFSKHFINIDLKDFFPSINEAFIRQELLKFKEFFIINVSNDKYQHLTNIELTNKIKDLTNLLLNAIINLATYKEVLPQGSPLSPVLSNLVGFKLDYMIEHLLKSQSCDNMVMYTRYADDLTFSSFKPMDLEYILDVVEFSIKSESLPFTINKEKTKYLKNTHRCYITGVKVNKDNHATYGHEKKAQLKRDIFHLFMMYLEGNEDLEQARETLGQLAYLQKIEPAYAKNMIKKYARKFNIREQDFYKHFINRDSDQLAF